MRGLAIGVALGCQIAVIGLIVIVESITVAAEFLLQLLGNQRTH